MIRYQITDGRILCQDADFIQIRNRELTARDLENLVRSVVRQVPAKVLVNDRADIAIACGAAGVHLRGGSVAPDEIRKIAPPGFVISVACHSVDDVVNAGGADYALLAPIFPPISKMDARAPLGLDAIRESIRGSSVPVIALGGITEENASACIAAGAVGIAGITLFERRLFERRLFARRTK